MDESANFQRALGLYFNLLSITPSPSPSLLVIFFQSGDVAERLE